MQKLAQVQESYLKTYQELSNSGVNFSGSLSQMRMAAASTYMTLDGFATLMKNNSQAFAKMGGTADEGAQAFVKVASTMQKSEIGDQLRALGYTSEQANEGLASYIAMTGGRNKIEMQDTQKLSAAAGEYMTQLDALAQITGKSREEQEKALKEANANAAYEQMMAGMNESQKAAYNKGLAEMSAKFGKAGEDLFKSQAMGLPPMTEAAQKLQALSPEVGKASQGMADIGKRGGAAAETYRKSAEATEGAVVAAKRLQGVAGALSFSAGGTNDALMGLTKESTRARLAGTETADAAEAQQKEIAAKQKTRLESEAASAAEAKKSLNELGQQIINRLMPIFADLIGFVNKVTIGFADFAKYLLESPKLLTALGIAIAGITAGFVALRIATAAATAVENAKKLAAGFGKGGGVKGALAALGPLGSKGNPMYVIALGGGLGGGPGSRGGPGGRGGGKGLAKLAGTAGKFAKVGGVVGGLVGAASLYGDISDIGEKEKRGEITAEEAKKAKGGAVGEASGGLAGAAAGAAAGALLGSVVPVLGTAIGGLIGGAVGGFGGGELGKKAGEWFSSPSDKSKNTTPVPEIKEGPKPIPVSFESQTKTLQTDVQALNTTMREVLKYVRETADYTKRTVDATRALNGNFFPTP
jgi:hypothetical protein